jgi:hypothetical protein
MNRTKYILRSKDVAHLLDCLPDEVGVLAKTGKLHGVKKGKIWLFRLQDVEACRSLVLGVTSKYTLLVGNSVGSMYSCKKKMGHGFPVTHCICLVAGGGFEPPTSGL